MRFFVGWTGASGAIYGVRLVRTLLEAGAAVDLCITDSGAKVIRHEVAGQGDFRPSDAARLLGGDVARLRVYSPEEVEAPVSSGSHGCDGAVVCPCSMGTAGCIAAGTSRNLIERVADVMLKEARRLVLVVRETPLSLIHLRNLARVAEDIAERII